MFKRTLLICLVVALAIGLLPQTPSSAQNEVSPIVIGTLDLPTVLDPALADTFMEWEILSHLYTGLTRQVPGTVDYELAAATGHDVSADGLTHTFTLRDDLLFSDGSPITAQTFADSIQRVINLNDDGASVVTDVVTTVTAIDDLTLQFRLRAAIPYFEELVSLPPFFAVHPDDFSAGRVSDGQDSLISNGVYVLESYAEGPIFTLALNPLYQFGDPAQNNGVILRLYPDTYLLQQAIEQGDVDVAWRDVRFPDAVALADADSAIDIATVPSSRMWYMAINTNESVPNTEQNRDPIFREVLVGMIDRELVTEDYFDGFLTPSYSLVPEFVGGAYNPIYTAFADPQAALDLLSDNGYSPNRPMSISIICSQQVYGSYYSSALGTFRVGMSAVNRYIIVYLSTNLNPVGYLESLEEGAFSAPVFAFTPRVPHADAYLRALLHSESPIASNHNYAQSEIDVLLNQARRTNDVEVQNTAYREAQTLIASTNTIVPLWQDVVSVLYRSEIDGVVLEANYFLHYDLLTRQ